MTQIYRIRELRATCHTVAHVWRESGRDEAAGKLDAAGDLLVEQERIIKELRMPPGKGYTLIDLSASCTRAADLLRAGDYSAHCVDTVNHLLATHDRLHRQADTIRELSTELADVTRELHGEKNRSRVALQDRLRTVAEQGGGVPVKSPVSASAADLMPIVYALGTGEDPDYASGPIWTALRLLAPDLYAECGDLGDADAALDEWMAAHEEVAVATGFRDPSMTPDEEASDRSTRRWIASHREGHSIPDGSRDDRLETRSAAYMVPKLD